MPSFQWRRRFAWVAAGMGMALFYVILIKDTWEFLHPFVALPDWLGMLHHPLFVPLMEAWWGRTPIRLLALVMMGLLLFGMWPAWQQPLPEAWIRRRWLADLARLCLAAACLDCVFVLFQAFGWYVL